MRKEGNFVAYFAVLSWHYVDGCKTVGQLVIRLKLKTCGAKSPFLGQQSPVSIRV